MERMKSTDAALLQTAISIATQAHAGQVDKAGYPYILHPIRVMEEFMWFVDPEHALGHAGLDRAVVGVLHDVIEDTTETLETVETQLRRISPASRVKPIVAALDAITHRPNEPYFESYIVRVLADPIAAAVKYKDVFDNTRRLSPDTMDHKTFERLTEKYERAYHLLRPTAYGLRGH
mgnify:CR=1 FL=1